MRFLSEQKTISVTEYSSLSRNEISRFLSTLSDTKVYPHTIVKLCNLLVYPKDRPIPFNEVQRIYLLAVSRELIGGGSATYNETMLACRLGRHEDKDKIVTAWEFVSKLGGLNSAAFNDKLTKFYIERLLDK